MSTAPGLVLLNQTVNIDDVSMITVSAIVDDGTNTNTSIRSIKIFVDPTNLGLAPVLEVHVKTPTASVAQIEIQTPNLNF